MINRKLGRIKKHFVILLVLGFVLSVTAASASAAGNGKDGYNKGYDDGKKQGQKDCEQYGSRETLSKIPSPPSKNGWTRQNRDNYNSDYEKGYIDGYNGKRYSCLK
jgi:hypothetical protein